MGYIQYLHDISTNIATRISKIENTYRTWIFISIKASKSAKGGMTPSNNITRMQFFWINISSISAFVYHRFLFKIVFVIVRKLIWLILLLWPFFKESLQSSHWNLWHFCDFRPDDVEVDEITCVITGIIIELSVFGVCDYK